MYVAPLIGPMKNDIRDVSVIDEMQKSPIEKRKRNLKTISPHSRGERKI